MIGKKEIYTTDDIDSTVTKPQILGGSIANASLAANSIKTGNITFKKAFSNNPIVIVSLRGTSTASAYGNLTCACDNVTTTGFTYRIYNGDSSARVPGINWIAVGYAAK